MRSCLALVFFAQGLGPVVRLLSGLYSDWLFVPVRSGWFAPLPCPFALPTDTSEVTCSSFC